MEGALRRAAVAGRRGTTAALLAAGLIAFGSDGVAAAQTDGYKAARATGSVTGGTTAKVRAIVARDTSKGKACVLIHGYLRRAAAWEHGCGPLTVEIDDGLSTGRLRGTLPTSYGLGSDTTQGWKGNGTVTVDVSLSGTGILRPGDDTYSIIRCNPFANYQYCYVPNQPLARSAIADGTVASRNLGTSGFSGEGTLAMERNPWCC